jgi:hypothetical protein
MFGDKLGEDAHHAAVAQQQQQHPHSQHQQLYSCTSPLTAMTASGAAGPMHTPPSSPQTHIERFG